jgi:hypothetical protein
VFARRVVPRANTLTSNCGAFDDECLAASCV